MKFNIQAAPIPSNFRGTPQQLLDAFLDRLEITSDAATFTESDTEPTQNDGPWFKNGTQLWVWDEVNSVYMPLDISASFTKQIWVGETAPSDAGTTYQIWFKLSGTAVVGLFYYMGADAGWVEETAELGVGTVLTANLADGAVTTEKIANGAVTSAKLANGVSVSKLDGGSNYEFLRMLTSSEPSWEPLLQESEDKDIVVNTWITVDHGLGRVPNILEAVLVCRTAEFGWGVNDEAKLQIEFADSGAGAWAGVDFRGATKVGICFPTGSVFKVRDRVTVATLRTITVNNWKIKFYYGIG